MLHRPGGHICRVNKLHVITHHMGFLMDRIYRLWLILWRIKHILHDYFTMWWRSPLFELPKMDNFFTAWWTVWSHFAWPCHDATLRNSGIHELHTQNRTINCSAVDELRLGCSREHFHFILVLGQLDLTEGYAKIDQLVQLDLTGQLDQLMNWT
jgi:hypothetical protein